MKLTDEDIRDIVRSIGQSLSPKQVLLFGSYADGSATDESDLDLLIIMDSDKPRYQRSCAVRALFWPPKAPMDVLVFTPDEVERWNGTPNHIVTEVLAKGKVLYAA